MYSKVQKKSTSNFFEILFLGIRSIRAGPWKLIPGTKELYNLETDIQELTNLYDQKPNKVQNLQAQMDRMIRKVNERELRTDLGRKQGVC